MEIIAVFPGPKLSRRALEHRVFPYLLRNVSAKHPNRILGIDITYVRLGPRLWLGIGEMAVARQALRNVAR